MRCKKRDCRHPLKINTKTINNKTQWLLVQGGEGHWSRRICNWHLLLQFESEMSPNAWCVKGWSPGRYNWSEITGRDNWCLKRRVRSSENWSSHMREASWKGFGMGYWDLGSSFFSLCLLSYAALIYNCVMMRCLGSKSMGTICQNHDSKYHPFPQKLIISGISYNRKHNYISSFHSVTNIYWTYIY